MYTSAAIAHFDERPEKKSFTPDEACSIFFNWKDAVIENAKEYEIRIKKLKLLRIMKAITENELTQMQRDIVRLHYFEKKSGEEIAALYGVNRSTVSRMISRIEGIYRENMKYAFEYSELDLAMEAPPVRVGQAIAFMAAMSSSPRTMGERIRRLREGKLLTTKQAAAATDMSADRLEKIEKSGNMTVGELVKLLLFFSADADYVIFGV